MVSEVEGAWRDWFTVRMKDGWMGAGGWELGPRRADPPGRRAARASPSWVDEPRPALPFAGSSFAGDACELERLAAPSRVPERPDPPLLPT